MNFECRINKATDTRSEYVQILLYHGKSCYANALQCYVETYIASLFKVCVNQFVHKAMLTSQFV